MGKIKNHICISYIYCNGKNNNNNKNNNKDW